MCNQNRLSFSKPYIFIIGIRIFADRRSTLVYFHERVLVQCFETQFSLSLISQIHRIFPCCLIKNVWYAYYESSSHYFSCLEDASARLTVFELEIFLNSFPRSSCFISTLNDHHDHDDWKLLLQFRVQYRENSNNIHG